MGRHSLCTSEADRRNALTRGEKSGAMLSSTTSLSTAWLTMAATISGGMLAARLWDGG